MLFGAIWFLARKIYNRLKVNDTKEENWKTRIAFRAYAFAAVMTLFSSAFFSYVAVTLLSPGAGTHQIDFMWGN